MIEKNKKLESSIRTNKIILERLKKKLNDSAAEQSKGGGVNSGLESYIGEAFECGTNTAIKGQIECIKNKIQKKELKIETLKKGGESKGVEVRPDMKPVSGKSVGKRVRIYDIALPEEITKTVRNRNFKQNYYKNNNIIEKTKRYIDSFYDEYLKIEETIPDYMIKNLEKMPNNKGYIWRGIRLYGKLTVPNSSNAKTVYLDERKHGEMFIHEITPVVENLYKKNGNGYGKHQLVSNTVRKIKKHTPSK